MLGFLPHINPVHCDYSGASTIDQMVDAVLEQAPEQSHLIGFSLGGYLGCLAAQREPYRFTCVSAVATSPNGLTESEKSLRRNNANILKNHPVKRLSKKRLQQFLHPDNMENQEIVNTILQMEKDLGKHVLIRQLLGSIDRNDISKELLQLAIPIQFIVAEDDQLVPVEPVYNLSKRAHHIVCHNISDSGHMIPLEAPEKLASLLA